MQLSDVSKSVFPKSFGSGAWLFPSGNQAWLLADQVFVFLPPKVPCCGPIPTAERGWDWTEGRWHCVCAQEAGGRLVQRDLAEERQDGPLSWELCWELLRTACHSLSWRSFQGKLHSTKRDRQRETGLITTAIFTSKDSPKALQSTALEIRCLAVLPRPRAVHTVVCWSSAFHLEPQTERTPIWTVRDLNSGC